MRIFWFTNILMPDVCEALYRAPELIGGWMSSLLDGLRKSEEISLAVATIFRDVSHIEKMLIRGVTYYLIPQSTSKGDELGTGFVQRCDEVIRDFSPDLIHVHGTEDVYGLYTSRANVPCPVVVSIQGLLSVCYRHVLGGMSLADYCDAGLAGSLAWLRFALQGRQWRIRGEREVRAIEGNRNFIGRTLWDKAHVAEIQPLSDLLSLRRVAASGFQQNSLGYCHDKSLYDFLYGCPLPLEGISLATLRTFDSAQGVSRYPGSSSRCAMGRQGRVRLLRSIHQKNDR